MVKIGVFSDTHVGCSIPNAISERRRAAFRHAFTRAIDALIRSRVDLVIHAGDLFERRSMKPEDTVFVKEELQRLVEELGGIPILAVRGNHDGTRENSALDYVRHPLAKYLKVLGDPSPCSSVYAEGGIVAAAVGYTPHPAAAIRRAAADLRGIFAGAECSILIVHSFVSCQRIPPGVPEHQVVGVDLLGESGARIVIAGHNHEYHGLVRIGETCVLTPGSTESINLSESGPHGVCVLDVGGGVKCDFIEIEPLYVAKTVYVGGEGRVRQVEWYREQAASAVKSFIEDLGGREGILKIVLRGVVDGDRLEAESASEAEARKAAEGARNLIYVEVESQLEEVSAAPQPSAATRDQFLSEVFGSILGFSEEALSLVSEVEAALEERASAKTGLLTESDRREFVRRWLKILGDVK